MKFQVKNEPKAEFKTNFLETYERKTTLAEQLMQCMDPDEAKSDYTQGQLTASAE